VLIEKALNEEKKEKSSLESLQEWRKAPEKWGV
jgi:hypothetical protein